MTQAVAEVLEDPTLPELVVEFQVRLQKEVEARARFYEEVDDSSKAEFINGEIIMHSPVADWHGVAQLNLSSLLHAFVRLHKLGLVRNEKALCRFPRNDYEPDIVFFGSAKAAPIGPRENLYPIPDFVCEVLSDSTEHRDRGVKFRDYEAHGVGEYWIFDPETKMLEQYVLHEGKYTLELKSATGEVQSTVIRGFRIPITAISDSDENLRVLSAMLAHR